MPTRYATTSPDTDADHTGDPRHGAMDPAQAPRRRGKRGGHGHREQGHPENRPDAEHSQIEERAAPRADRRHDQQRDRGGSGEAVYDTDHQRAKMTTEASASCCDLDVPQRPSEIQRAEDDQHRRHRHLHRQADADAERPARRPRCRAYEEDRRRVADAPDGSNHRRTAQGPLAAGNGGDRDDVVRVRGVPHPEEEPDHQQRERIAMPSFVARSCRIMPPERRPLSDRRGAPSR